jgi:hypothetical protein
MTSFFFLEGTLAAYGHGSYMEETNRHTDVVTEILDRI